MKRAWMLALGTLAGLLLLSSATPPVFTQSQTINNYVLVSQRAISLTVFEYTYRASLVNGGTPLSGATATVVSLSSATTIVDNNLAFGPVGAGGTVASSDTFTFRQNRTVPFSFANLQWTIVPAAANQPPLVDAGSDQAITLPINSLQLNGTATDDGLPTHTLTISWSKVSGPGTVTFSPPNAAVTTATFSQAGPYVLRLTANDSALSASDDVNVAVNVAANRTPVANAGPDQSLGRGATVTLNGNSSSDPDGDPLTYQWSFVQVPSGSAAVLSNPTSAGPTFVTDKAGLYRVRLIVSDATSSSAPDTVDITAVNGAPVANAGPDQNIAGAGTLVTLDGSASSDPDNDPLTYLWSQTSGPQVTLSSPTAVKPTFVPSTKGTYVFRLVVNDGTVASAPDSVSIVVANTAPVANAGPDQTAPVGQTVQLSGATSSDVDGDPLTFSWALMTRPQGSQATLNSTTIVTPTFLIDVAGSYVVRLIVSDGTVNSAADTVIVSTSNSAPVANAGPDQTVLVTQTVQLDGSGSSDVDGNPLTYTWSFVSRPSGSAAVLSSSNTVNPTFVADRSGSYVVQLVVSDGFVTSAADTVTITTRNTPPVANAGPDQSVLVGQTVTLDGSASTDVDGNPLTYAWALTTRPSGSNATLSNPSAVMPTFVVDKAGSYVAQLIVNDGIVNSAPDTVTIATHNTPPVANAGPDQTAVAGRVVTLDGGASSDVDGQPLTYTWSILTRPTGSTATLSNPTTVSPFFTSDKPGAYVVQLIVNDGIANSAPDTVMVTTTNTAPIANAGPDQLTVVVGSTVTLNGTLSSDADNHPLTFHWSLLSKPVGSAAVLSNPGFAMPTFVLDVAGDYVAQLIVNDGFVDSAPDTVLIRSANRPPVANAGSPQSVLTGATVHLDGSGSSDPDGQTLTYSWSLQSFPQGSTATLSNPTSVNATFVADLAGAYVIQLQVSDGSLTNNASVTVTASTAQGTLSLSATSLTFQSTQIGQSSAAQTITVTNTSGTTAVLLSAVTISGDFASSTTTGPCGAGVSVPPGGTCTIGVLFHPTAAGQRNGNVSIVSNASGSPHTVTLTGTGVAASVTPQPTSLPFQDTQLGATRTLTVTLSNTGVGPVQVNAASLVGDAVSFAIVGGTCPATLNASGQGGQTSCTLTVRFQPAATGPLTSTLSIPTDAAGTISVPITGTGVSGNISISPNPAAFANTQVGSTRGLAVFVQNTTANPVTINTPTITGSPAFTIVTNTCATLAPQIQCQITLQFAPTSTNPATATLMIPTNAAGTFALPVSGTGQAPSANVSPSPVSFSNTQIGSSQTVAVFLTNTGVGPIVANTPTLTGDPAFTIVANSCGTLIAGAICQVNLRFAPTTTSPVTGTLTIPTDLAGPFTVPISGTGQAASASVSATSVAFANTQIGSSRIVPLFVTNTGVGPVAVNSASLTGDAAFTIATNSCATLAAGANCQINLQFAPTTANTVTGSLSISTDLAGGFTVPLSGTGQAASATASPNPVAFANTQAGSTRTTSVTVTNNGIGPVTINTPTLTGDASFTVSGNTCTTLSPGSQCQITLQFAPTTVGLLSATLSIPTNVAGTFTIPVSGTGFSALTIAPPSLNFGDTPVNQTSASQLVTLSNNGTQPITINSIVASAGFGVASTTCTATLNGGQSCTVSVNFAPTATGVVNGSLTVSSNAAGSPHGVSLTGRGVAGVLSIAPTSLTYSDQLVGTASVSQSVTVTNTGNLAVTFNSVATNNAEFNITSNTCSGSLAIGANCSVAVRFVPAAIGTRTGSLTIASSALSSPHAVGLSGTGIAGTLLVPPQLNLGGQQVGTVGTAVVISVTNTSAIPVTFGTLSISPAGNFVLASNTCVGTLAGGASCSIGIQFTPTVSGHLTASLLIPSNAAGNPHVMTLVGDGGPLPPGNDSTVATLTFFNPAPLQPPNPPPGNDSASATLTFFNPAPLQPPAPPAQASSANATLTFFNPAPVQPPNPPPQSSSASGTLSFFNPAPLAPPNPPPQASSAEAGVSFSNGPSVDSVSPGLVSRNGQPVTLTINGRNLTGATTVVLSPSTGITVGAPTVSPDGRTVTVSITASASAATGVVDVVVSGPGFSTPAGAGRFVVQ
jgi:hypothetical protein